MPEQAVPRVYPQGVPCWIDLETPDAQAVAPFYAELLSWDLADAMPADAPGHYLIATLDGRDVAAIASGVAAIGRSTVWSTYIAVDDADASAVSVERAGGAVTVRPADNPGGRVAVCADPQGAAFRLWQPGRRLGAQVANVPGAWNFSDLRTADVAAAVDFYAEVFGWRTEDVGLVDGVMLEVPGYGEHLASTVDPGIFDRQRAIGATPGFADAIGAVLPARGAAPHWHVTFSVADRDAAVATVERLGGVVDGTSEGGWARRAEVRDPTGAAFTVSQFTPR